MFGHVYLQNKTNGKTNGVIVIIIWPWLTSHLLLESLEYTISQTSDIKWPMSRFNRYKENIEDCCYRIPNKNYFLSIFLKTPSDTFVFAWSLLLILHSKQLPLSTWFKLLLNTILFDDMIMICSSCVIAMNITVRLKVWYKYFSYFAISITTHETANYSGLMSVNFMIPSLVKKDQHFPWVWHFWL